jgi:hypothetical protein
MKVTVQELIERLQFLPGHLRVVVSGYEGGYNDITIFREIPLSLNVHPEWYYGAHAEAETEIKDKTVPALWLGGENSDREL